jgi:hypothetical protein
MMTMVFGRKKQEHKEVGNKKIGIKSKEERFKKVASRRVDDILHKLRLLSNCAHTGNYSYSEGQVNKLLSTIERELKDVRADFRKGVAKTTKEKFSFD